MKTNVVLNGPSTLYVRVADSGNQVSYRFCPSCGATVVYEIEALPDAIAVPLGALIEGDLPVPTVSVYEARMQPWLSLREPIEHLD